ncbi:MAG: flagellar basal body L-ring protein FlgH [Rhizomicrobium sp.]
MAPALLKVLSLAGCVAALAGCTAVDRIKEIGDPPTMAGIADPNSPVHAGTPNVPLPPPPEPTRALNSLWSNGAHSFFHDPRARPARRHHHGQHLGRRHRPSCRTPRRATAPIPTTPSDELLRPRNAAGRRHRRRPSSLVKMGSDMSNAGSGSINRSEAINLTLAALVTQVLPNGNLVIGGHQQVRVNNELRDLQVAGIVRTEDITSANTVDLSQIAEARISYGGRGTVTDVQQPRYGSQLFDILMPF